MITFVVYKYDKVVTVPPSRHHFTDAEEAKEYAKTTLLKTTNTASVAVEVDGVEIAHYYNYKR